MHVRPSFGDFVPQSVQEGAQSPEVTSTINSERENEIHRFSPEARKALERKGFVVYGLTGQSIATMAGTP